MAWHILNTSLSVDANTMKCNGGLVTATLTVTGKTDGQDEVNSYTASIRDDYVIPDTLWDSGPQSAGPNTEVNETFKVQLSCSKSGKVVGPNGSSGEKTAELYAYVLSEDLESASGETIVTCVHE